MTVQLRANPLAIDIDLSIRLRIILLFCVKSNLNDVASTLIALIPLPHQRKQLLTAVWAVISRNVAISNVVVQIVDSCHAYYDNSCSRIRVLMHVLICRDCDLLPAQP